MFLVVLACERHLCSQQHKLLNITSPFVISDKSKAMCCIYCRCWGLVVGVWKKYCMSGKNLCTQFSHGRHRHPPACCSVPILIPYSSYALLSFSFSQCRYNWFIHRWSWVMFLTVSREGWNRPPPRGSSLISLDITSTRSFICGCLTSTTLRQTWTCQCMDICVVKMAHISQRIFYKMTKPFFIFFEFFNHYISGSNSVQNDGAGCLTS